MNTDEIKILKDINHKANTLPFTHIDIRQKVWQRLKAESQIIEVDSFRYIAIACAVAAIIAIFFSIDIMSNIQSTVAWEISDQSFTIF